MELSEGRCFFIKHNIDRGRTVTDNRGLSILKRTTELQKDFNATYELPLITTPKL
jgi:hypothetical protein